MNDMNMTGSMTAMTAWMVVWGLVGLALLIVAGFAIAGFIRHGGTAGRPSDDAAGDILKRRYAAGEIDDTEYQRRRTFLSAT